MKGLVIIPAFNEELNIEKVIDSVFQLNLNVDVLVVNDGSIDNTGQIALATNKAKVLDLPFNLGIGGCVQTGFKFALNNDYDFAVQCDGDGQHLASDLAILIREFTGEDFLIGSRFLSKKQIGFKSSFCRRMGIFWFKVLFSVLYGKKITDATSGLRIYGRKALKLLAKNYSDDYPEPEAIAYLLRNNLSPRELPVEMQDRQEGKSSITFFKSIYYMVKVSIVIVIWKFRR